MKLLQPIANNVRLDAGLRFSNLAYVVAKIRRTLKCLFLRKNEAFCSESVEKKQLFLRQQFWKNTLSKRNTLQTDNRAQEWQDHWSNSVRLGTVFGPKIKSP